MTDNKDTTSERPINPYPLRRVYLVRDFKIILSYCALICLLLHLWLVRSDYTPAAGLDLSSWRGLCDLCISARDLIIALGLFLLLRLALASIEKPENFVRKMLGKAFLSLEWLANKISAAFIPALGVTVVLLLAHSPLSILFPVALLTAQMGFLRYSKPRAWSPREDENDLLDRFLVVRECMHRLGFEYQNSLKRFVPQQGPAQACLSIEGPWGSGKSFILRKICHHLQESGQTIAFISPWTAKGSDECLAELVETLERAATGYDPLCSRCRKNSVLSLLSLGLTQNNDVTNVLSSLIQTPSADDASRLDLLDEELGKTGDIYLIIDDSERSHPETFHRLLPVLERLKSLKKIHVIAAFNTEMVREMFRENGRNGYESCSMAEGYLNKIFTYRLSLPDAETYTKEGFIRYCIDRRCQGQADEEKMKEILGKALTYDGANEQSPFFAPNYPRTTELGVDLVVTYLQMEIWHYASEANHDELIQNVKDLFFFTCLKNEFPHVYDEVSNVIIKSEGRNQINTQLEAYANSISGAKGSDIKEFPATYEANRNDSAYIDYKRYLTPRLRIFKSERMLSDQEYSFSRNNLLRIISYTYRTHPYLTLEEKENIVEILLEDRQKPFDVLNATSEALHYDASNSYNFVSSIIDFIIDQYRQKQSNFEITLSDIKRIMDFYSDDIYLNKIESLNEDAFMKMIDSYLQEIDQKKQKRTEGCILVWKNYIQKKALLHSYASISQEIELGKKSSYPHMTHEAVVREFERRKDLLDAVLLPLVQEEYFSGKRLWTEEDRLAIFRKIDLLDLFPKPYSDIDKMNIFLILCDFHLRVCRTIIQKRSFCEEANNELYNRLFSFTISSETDIRVDISEKDRSTAYSFIGTVFSSAQSTEWKALLKDIKTYVLLLISASKLERICIANEECSTENGKACRNVEEINRRMTKKNPLGWDIPWQENVDIDEWVSKYDEYIRSMQKTSGA